MRSLSVTLATAAMALALAATLGTAAAAQAPDPAPPMPALQPHEGDFVTHDFHFRDGETLPELRLHYITLGQPRRDAQGHVTNAVMVLHGTGGTGEQFLKPQFAGVLFKPGGLLDPATHFIVLPDNIGHGKSSKPSDGLHARFPHYDYDDMVIAQHLLLTQGLKADHLRLVMGTSMGCMHSFVWAEMYPDFISAAMPLACEPVQIAGRNRIWRKMLMHSITADPAWKGGDYTAEPTEALRAAEELMVIAGTTPLPMQIAMPTRQSADAWVDENFEKTVAGLDANDLLYQVDSSRNYDPSPKLESITVPLTWINSGDDFINPPDLGIAEREIKRIKRGRYVLIPASYNTHGHGTHTWAAIWQDRLAELLKESE